MTKPKFRAWDIYREKMLYGKGVHEEGVWLALALYGELFDCANDRADDGPVTDDYILMLYTGIKDRNNIEIYEGDIVRWIAEEICDPYRSDPILGIVEWSEPVERENLDSFCDNAGFVVVQITEGIHQLKDDNWEFKSEFYDYDGRAFNWHDLEVIGNIYENPNLIPKNAE